MRIKELFAQEKPFFIGVPAFLWQALFFYVPLVFILVLSILKITDTSVFGSITFQYYKPFLSSLYLVILLKSLALALANAFLCFIVGYPVAYFLSFRAGKFKNFYLFLLIVPFWTNLLLHIYAWFFVLERTGFLNTILLTLGLIRQPLHLLNSLWAIMVVMLYSYVPFMVLPIYSVLERFDHKLVEASADLGATAWQTWSRILLPLSMTGVQSGILLVLVPSFGEFAIPGLLGGEKYMFVGTVISQYMLANKTISLGAAFTVLSSIGLVIAIIAIFMLIRKMCKHC